MILRSNRVILSYEWSLGNARELAEKGVRVSAVYNPEAETMAQIERLELEARDMQVRLLRMRNPEDERVVNRLLNELKEDIFLLQARLPF